MKSNRLFKISIDYNTFDWAMQPPPQKKNPLKTKQNDVNLFGILFLKQYTVCSLHHLLQSSDTFNLLFLSIQETHFYKSCKIKIW